MDSSSANHNNQEEDDANNSSRHHISHVFSPPPPAPQPPLSQSPPPPQPFWNFISPPVPPSPPLSQQRLFHTSTCNYTTNNASALNFTLTNRPSGRSGGRNISNHHQPCAPGSASKPNQRRRTEHLIAAAAAASSSSTTTPQPSSPSPPCTECGRRFPSAKALFGHMRCHPERTWRGIIPPSNARRTLPSTSGTAEVEEIAEEELEVAETLIFLATGFYPKRKTTSGKGSSAQTAAACLPGSGTPEEPAAAGGFGRSNGRALDESHEQAPVTINVHGEGNDRFGVDTSGGRHAPAGHNRINLQEGRGRGVGHVSSSSSSRKDIPDLNFPPPLPSPENE